jgi:hypothetical protein
MRSRQLTATCTPIKASPQVNLTVIAADRLQSRVQTEENGREHRYRQCGDYGQTYCQMEVGRSPSSRQQQPGGGVTESKAGRGARASELEVFRHQLAQAESRTSRTVTMKPATASERA